MECGARGRAANRVLVTDSVLESLRASLSPAYRIERELVGGGMSRVFLAEELRFGRKVVIKVLPPDVSGAISAERFEREIQLVARLSARQRRRRAASLERTLRQLPDKR
jgi:serine/threonine protein kinase